MHIDPARSQSTKAMSAPSADAAPSLGSTSGSASTSCSGSVRGRYFYIYAYQYAYVYNGEVQSESHSFSMSGFLGNEKDWQLQRRATDRHIMYRNGDRYLAIPYKNSADGLFYSEGIPGPGEPQWIRLCGS